MKKYKKLILNESKEEAYWISPLGKTLMLKGSSKHIDIIFDNPNAFGLTVQHIHQIYDKYKEEYGVEGRAREEIIKGLLSKGWIRIRKYMKPYRWTLNVNKLTNRNKDIIKSWSDEMLLNSVSLYDEVLIDTSILKKIFTFQELSNDILFTEKVKDRQRYIIEFVERL